MIPSVIHSSSPARLTNIQSPEGPHPAKAGPAPARGLAVYNVVAMFSDADLRDPKFSRRDFLNLAGKSAALGIAALTGTEGLLA